MGIRGKPANRPARYYGRLAVDIVLGLFVGRLSGLVREMAFVYVIGATAWLDMFIQLTSIPDVVTGVVFAGTAATIYLPIYHRVDMGDSVEKSPEISIWNFSALLSAFLVVAIAGTEASFATIGVTSPALTYLALVVLFACQYVSCICQTILQHENRPFFAYFSAAILNFSAVALLFATRGLLSPLKALFISIVLANILRVAVLVAISWRGLLRYRWLPLEKIVLTVSSLRSFAPRWLGLALASSVMQLLLFLDRWHPTDQTAGYVSYLNLSQKLLLVPFGVLGTIVELVALKWVLSADGSADKKGRLSLKIGLVILGIAAVLSVGIAPLLRGWDTIGAYLPAKVNLEIISHVGRLTICYLPLVLTECCTIFLVRVQSATRSSAVLFMISAMVVTIKIVFQIGIAPMLSSKYISADVTGPAVSALCSFLLSAIILFQMQRRQSHLEELT